MRLKRTYAQMQPLETYRQGHSIQLIVQEYFYVLKQHLALFQPRYHLSRLFVPLQNVGSVFVQILYRLCHAWKLSA